MGLLLSVRIHFVHLVKPTSNLNFFVFLFGERSSIVNYVQLHLVQVVGSRHPHNTVKAVFQALSEVREIFLH